VEDNSTQGGSSPSSEAEFSRMIRAEVESWHMRRGPDWPDILMRVAAVGPSPWLVYAAASGALVVILVSAYLIGSWLQLGALAPQPVQVHLP
jgi:hypothetical protein